MSYVSHYKGERKQDRRTPREFFDKLHGRFGFTMDGAATARNALLPKYSSRSLSTWQGDRVFCNPPWSNIPPFVELAATAEFACLLVPARTNCKWFHRALELGAKPEFWLGKLSFDGPWNSPVDCLLLIFESASPSPHAPEQTHWTARPVNMKAIEHMVSPSAPRFSDEHMKPDCDCGKLPAHAPEEPSVASNMHVPIPKAGFKLAGLEDKTGRK